MLFEKKDLQDVQRLHGNAECRPSRFKGGGMRYLRFGKWLGHTLEIVGGIKASLAPAPVNRAMEVID